jgi:signal transduction histidine kinase
MPAQMHVKGNAELIFRALENVVRNAVLHAPANTLVEIAVRSEEAGRWQIKVADQGRGVPPSDLDAIFQPFFRSSTNGDTAGYGLGLAITQRVVIAHGGKVRAENRASGGLQVEIILPAA